MLYGDYLSMIEQNSGKSMEEFLRARELDPFSPLTHLNVAAAYYMNREYRRAATELRRALELFPDFWNLHLHLSLALAMEGRFEESLAEVQATALSSDKIWAIQGRGTAYGLCGKRDQAVKAIEELESLSKEQYVSPTAFAPIFAAIGDRDGAFRCFEKAFREKSPDLPGEILGHPLYTDKLGADPRWTELLQKMGLESRRP